MISVQYPHFPAHPFDAMSEPPLHSGLPALSRIAVQAPNSSFADSKGKQSTSVGVKKRPSRAGTRSVSTLTQAQLERKRANDREAQRAIRQRTKDHIDNLEKQIRELTSNNDTGAKLMQAMQRNKELEQEIALLRTRFNHAIATMSEHGLSSDHIMLSTGPSSPTRRLKLVTQIRTSTTPAPRSIPTPTASAVGPQEQWNSTYSPASSSMDRSPSVTDVSPVSASLRWGQQAPQVSPSIPDSERPMHGVDPNMQSQMNYNFVQPVQPVAYHSEAQMMSSYAPTASPTGQVGDFQNRHPGSNHYATYPPTQGYMPHSPHESDPHMQMMQHRQSIDSQPQMMYNMAGTMKSEH